MPAPVISRCEKNDPHQPHMWHRPGESIQESDPIRWCNGTFDVRPKAPHVRLVLALPTEEPDVIAAMYSPGGLIELVSTHHAGTVLEVEAIWPQVACRVCGCTDDDCSQCIEATGAPCGWAEQNLCTRCAADG